MNLKALNPYYLVSKTCQSLTQTKDRQLSSATSFWSDNAGFPAKSGHHQGTQSKVFNIQKPYSWQGKETIGAQRQVFKNNKIANICTQIYLVSCMMEIMRSQNSDRDLQKGPYPYYYWHLFLNSNAL